MPMMLFRNRGFSNGCVASFVLMAGVFGLGFLTAQYLQLALHYNPLGVGLRLLPATGMALILAPIAGRLTDRIGERPLVILGLGLEATGLLLIGALVTARGDSPSTSTCSMTMPGGYPARPALRTAIDLRPIVEIPRTHGWGGRNSRANSEAAATSP
jgi:MFS family permease